MWQVDSGLKPIDGFKIQWGTEDPFEHEKTVEDKQRFYDIEKLEPDTEYTISVTVIYSLSALNDQTKSRSDPKYRMIKTKVRYSIECKSSLLHFLFISEHR